MTILPKKMPGSVVEILAKGWFIFSSVIGTLVLIVAFGMMAALGDSSGTDQSQFSENVIIEGDESKVAVVNMSGIILDEAESGSPLTFDQGVVSTRKMTSILKFLAEDDDIKAVVLRINSPGGAVVASDQLYQAVKSLSAEKPVVAQFNDLAASGGYYVAMGADKIIANPATITGSIGVIIQFPEFSGLYDKIGVGVRTFKSGKFKDIGSADRNMTNQEKAIIQSIIDQSYDQFVEAVVDGRNIDKDIVKKLADGRIYSGQQAHEARLIDALGGFETAVTTAEDLAGISNATVVEFSDESFFESLFTSANSNLSISSGLEKVIPSSHFGAYYLLSI
jgi:protease IV